QDRQLGGLISLTFDSLFVDCFQNWKPPVQSSNREITPGYFRPSDWLSVRWGLSVTCGVLPWFVSLITPHRQPMQPIGKSLRDSVSEVPASPERPRVGRFCVLLV